MRDDPRDGHRARGQFGLRDRPGGLVRDDYQEREQHGHEKHRLEEPEHRACQSVKPAHLHGRDRRARGQAYELEQKKNHREDNDERDNGDRRGLVYPLFEVASENGVIPEGEYDGQHEADEGERLSHESLHKPLNCPGHADDQYGDVQPVHRTHIAEAQQGCQMLFWRGGSGALVTCHALGLDLNRLPTEY